MTIDGDAAYQVLLARDARFDGRLFVGVTSTGIYCRPICRVRTPARRNCRFFATPAQAEAAAFRPCLKCRPGDRARARPAVDGDGRVAHAGAPGGASCSTRGRRRRGAGRRRRSPARLGVSDRHLRRIFFSEHGVTPLQYLQTRRLLLAKQLLTDTDLPVAQVALTSGFRSLRRFNAAFASGYRMNPTRLRRTAATAARAAARRRAASADAPRSRSLLGYRPPYDRRRPARLRRAARDPRHRGRRRPVDPAHACAPAPSAAEAGWLEARFIADSAARAALVRAGARRRRAAPSSRPCAAGSTSTPRPTRSTQRLAEPARRARAAPAGQRRRLRARGARGARPAGHGRRRRERWRAAWSSASAAASRRPGPTSIAPSPRPKRWPPRRSSASPSSASSAAAPARSRRWRRRWPELARRCSRRGASPERLVERLRELPGIGAVDRALHRDARARLARCLSAGRRRRAEGDAAALRHRRRSATCRRPRRRPGGRGAAYALLRLWNSLGVTP